MSSVTIILLYNTSNGINFISRILEILSNHSNFGSVSTILKTTLLTNIKELYLYLE
jgi:hypothetical protein